MDSSSSPHSSLFLSPPSPSVFLLPLLCSSLGYFVDFLTLSGSLSAFLVGSFVMLGGWLPITQLLIFFFIGSIATKVKQKQKEQQNPYKEKEEGEGEGDNGYKIKEKRMGRDAVQVWATGGIPAMMCLVTYIHSHQQHNDNDHFNDRSNNTHSFLPSSPHSSYSDSLLFCVEYFLRLSPLFFQLYLNTNLSDTLASELGMIFHIPNDYPRNILHLSQRVQKGIDGAITWGGTTAGGIGGAIIFAVAYFIPMETNSQHGDNMDKDPHHFSLVFGNSNDFWEIFCYGFVFGIIGTNLDSVLGMILQTKRIQTKKGKETQYDWWKRLNSLVNFLSCLATCAIGGGIYSVQRFWGINLMTFLCIYVANHLSILSFYVILPSLAKKNVFRAAVKATISTSYFCSYWISGMGMGMEEKKLWKWGVGIMAVDCVGEIIFGGNENELDSLSINPKPNESENERKPDCIPTNKPKGKENQKAK